MHNPATGELLCEVEEADAVSFNSTSVVPKAGSGDPQGVLEWVPGHPWQNEEEFI